MKFSILTAHYNNGRYLQQCYESIQKQTFQDFEWIIVDDASTDDSVVLIQNLIRHEPRAKLYLSDKNRGVGYTKKELWSFLPVMFVVFWTQTTPWFLRRWKSAYKLSKIQKLKARILNFIYAMSI